MDDRHGQARRNFFVRFWHGGYSLPFSYWVVSFLGNLAVIGVIGVVAAKFRAVDFNPYLSAGYVALIWALVVGWSIFQLVGVWRAATRYRDEKLKQKKSGAWGILAQIALVLGGIISVSEVSRVGVPQLQEAWRIAFEGDPSIPDYTIRVMRNGSELEIAGGFKYGLATDVEKVIQASPQVKVVHLNSIGGRLGEAEKLARLIKARGLATYTSATCASACTIAFASGRDRWLKVGARLGFHRGSFAGQEHADAMRAAMLKAGYDQSFVERAIAYPSDKMWYPTAAELQAAHAISGVVDNYKFATSGYGIRPGSEDFASELRKEPVFRAWEQADQSAFAKLSNEFQQRYIEGMPEGVIVERVRQAFATAVRSRLPMADDQILIDYAKLIADQYDAVGAVDAKACYEYATGGTDAGKAFDFFGADLKNRELRLSERILSTVPVRRSVLSRRELEALYGKVFEVLVARYGEAEARLVFEPAKVKLPQYAAYCKVAAAMFRELAQVPEAGTVLSTIFTEAAPGTK